MKNEEHLNQGPSRSPQKREDKMNLFFPNSKEQEKSKPGFMTAYPTIYRRIKEIQEYQKKYSTKSERIIWNHLRNKKTGHKIRRQHIIDRYIADFVCLRKKLVIEIDGKIHLKQKEYDEFRTSILNELGFEVIRFTNEEVLKDSEAVVFQIKEKLDSISKFSPSGRLRRSRNS